jgi:hypothetical protein
VCRRHRSLRGRIKGARTPAAAIRATRLDPLPRRRSNGGFLPVLLAASRSEMSSRVRQEELCSCDADGQPQRRGRRATGAREGGPVARSTRSVRYGAQGSEGNETTTSSHSTPTLFIPSPYFPVPHLYYHPPLACYLPPTFLQVLDHPLSTLGEGGQAPIHRPGPAVTLANISFCRGFKVWDRATNRRHPDPPRDRKHDNLATPFRPRSRPIGLGAKSARRPATGASFGSRGESCLPKKRSVVVRPLRGQRLLQPRPLFLSDGSRMDAGDPDNRTRRAVYIVDAAPAGCAQAFHPCRPSVGRATLRQ